MKISYRTNPIIRTIESHDFEFGIYEDDRFKFNGTIKDAIYDYIDRNKKDLASNVYIVTQPFADAYEKALPKLQELMRSEKLEAVFTKQILIYRSRTFIQEINESGSTLMIFDNTELVVFYQFKEGAPEIPSFISNELKHFTLNKMIAEMFLQVWFIKYCEVEVKFIGAGKKVKDVNCKYVNDTKTNVTILDSAWFKTVVKSDGFTVRGHFRLQACGKGMKERKLVWLSDFEKHGYTRNFKRPVTLEEFVKV